MTEAVTRVGVNRDLTWAAVILHNVVMMPTLTSPPLWSEPLVRDAPRLRRRLPPPPAGVPYTQQTLYEGQFNKKEKKPHLHLCSDLQASTCFSQALLMPSSKTVVLKFSSFPKLLFPRSHPQTHRW